MSPLGPAGSSRVVARAARGQRGAGRSSAARRLGRAGSVARRIRRRRTRRSRARVRFSGSGCRIDGACRLRDRARASGRLVLRRWPGRAQQPLDRLSPGRNPATPRGPVARDRVRRELTGRNCRRSARTEPPRQAPSAGRAHVPESQIAPEAQPVLDRLLNRAMPISRQIRREQPADRALRSAVRSPLTPPATSATSRYARSLN